MENGRYGVGVGTPRTEVEIRSVGVSTRQVEAAVHTVRVAVDETEVERPGKLCIRSSRFIRMLDVEQEATSARHIA